MLLDEYEKLLNSRTKLVSFTQVSNALGTVTPAKQMVEMAHRHGARVLVDGAQSVSHMRQHACLLIVTGLYFLVTRYSDRLASGRCMARGKYWKLCHRGKAVAT